MTAVAVGCSAIGAAGVQASTVTIGSPMTAAFTSQPFNSIATIVPTSMAGSTTVAPFDGTITSWSVSGASGGPFKLHVVRQVAIGKYASVGTAVSGPITGLGKLTFPASLPMKAGDLIGIDPNSLTDYLGAIPNGDAYMYFDPALADGGSGASPSGSGAYGQLALSAQLESPSAPTKKKCKKKHKRAAVAKKKCKKKKR